MIGRLRMMYLDLWDTARITATSSPGTAKHMLSPHREEVWYGGPSVGGEIPDQVITLRWERPQSINLVALERHDLSSWARVRYELLAGDNLLFDSGFMLTSNPIPAGEWRAGVDKIGATYDALVPVSVSELYLGRVWRADTVRITVRDPVNKRGWIKIERIPVGFAYEFRNNFSWGTQLRYRDSSSFRAVGGGGLRPKQGEVSRELAINLDWASSVDEAFMHLHISQSKSRPVFVSAYPPVDKGGGGLRSVVSRFTGYIMDDLAVVRSSARFSAAKLVIRES